MSHDPARVVTLGNGFATFRRGAGPGVGNPHPEGKMEGVSAVSEPANLYEAVGGEPTFRRIVARFYEEVARDEILRPLYPEEDLGPAAERFLLFLVQYWGGPTTYSDSRGHPRLRMRHAPFAVTPQAKDHWLMHFRAALDSVELTPEQDAQFWDYVTHAAQFMVNSFE
jgi:hemoglobin